MDGARLLPFASWPSEPVHVTLNWPLAGLEVVFENLTRTGRGARSRPGPGGRQLRLACGVRQQRCIEHHTHPRQDTDAPGRSGRVRLVRWSRGIRRDKELHGQEEGTSARHRPHGRDRPDRVRPVRARVRRVRARVPPLPRVACPVPAVGTDRVPHPVLGRHRHRDLRRHRESVRSHPHRRSPSRVPRARLEQATRRRHRLERRPDGRAAAQDHRARISGFPPNNRRDRPAARRDRGEHTDADALVAKSA